MNFGKQMLCGLAIGSTLMGLPGLAANLSDAAQGPSAQPNTRVALANGQACSLKGCDKMSLSVEQLEKLSSLKLQYLDKTASQKAEYFTLKRDLKDAITKPDADRNQLMALQSKINSLQADLANERLSNRLDTFNVLTPQQKEEVRRKALIGEVFGSYRGKGGFRHHSDVKRSNFSEKPPEKSMNS